MAKRSEKSGKLVSNRTRRNVADRPVDVSQPQTLAPASDDQFKERVTSRLIEILDQASVPLHGRVSFLAGLTGRNRQTVTAWLRGRNLPDLQSFAALAMTFDFDMYYVLGMTPAARRRLPISWTWARTAPGAADGDAVTPGLMATQGEIVSHTARLDSLTLRPMVGDAMAPEIKHNELMGIDTSVSAISGDGIYALEKEGVLFVRRIEVHFDGGYTLHSRNDHYGAVKVSNLNDPALQGMKVLGRVQCVVKPMS